MATMNTIVDRARKRAVQCATIAMVFGGVAVILSIASTTSCQFFSVVNRKGSLMYGIWGRYKAGSGLTDCVSFNAQQEINAKQKAAQAMTILSPIFGCLGLGFTYWGELTTNCVPDKLALASLAFIAAAICQLFTLSILDSALCTNNVDFSKILTTDCPKDSGATLSIVSCSFLGTAYVCTLLSMKFDGMAEQTTKEPNERNALLMIETNNVDATALDGDELSSSLPASDDQYDESDS